jgi:hypothetical protein
MTDHPESVISAPVSIFAEPAIVNSGADTLFKINSNSVISGAGLQVAVFHSSGAFIDIIDDVSIPSQFSWQIPSELQGELRVVLMQNDIELDVAVLEVGDERQVLALADLELGIQHERQALAYFQENRIDKACQSILEAAQKYESSGDAKLASRSLRQFVFELLNFEREEGVSLKPQIQNLADRSLTYAKSSGDNEELVRSMHLLGSPECTDDPRKASDILNSANQLLHQIDVSEALWCSHYSLAARVLRYEHFNSYSLLVGRLGFSRLAEIAKEGIYFALLSRDNAVRASCIDSLLPSCRDIFVSSNHELIIGYDGAETRINLRLSQAQQPQALVKPLDEVLTPTFSTALLAGISSFASFALEKSDPSARILLRIRRDDQNEMFELCEGQEDGRQISLQELAISWLESRDGVYYTNAVAVIWCKVYRADLLKSTNQSQSFKMLSRYGYSESPSILYGVEKSIPY